jgi:hypothetical protein
MEFDRCASLWIGDMYVTHRRRDHAVTEDPLHLREMNSRFKQIRRTGMPELMKAVHRNLCAA